MKDYIVDKRLLVLIVFINIFSLYGNDAWIDVAGGSIKTMNSKENSIQMLSESIYITLEDDYYEVDVIFYFYNHSDSKTVKIGFPKWDFGSIDDIDFSDLKIWHNSEIINDVEVIEEIDDPYISKWYARDLYFPKETITKSRVQYKVQYGVGRSVQYLFGTGSTWKGQINEIRINIKNNDNKWIYGYSPAVAEEKHEFSCIDENEFEIVINNIEPDEDDTFTLYCGDNPGWESVIFSNRAMWYPSVEVNLDDDAFLMLTLEQMRKFRNFYFATHGYDFKSDDLKNYFSKYDWYETNVEFDRNNMTPYQVDMVNRILKIEKDREYILQ